MSTVPYPPTTFRKDGVSETATTWADHHQYVYDGWKAVGITPDLSRELSPISRAELGNFENDPDVIAFRNALHALVTRTTDPATGQWMADSVAQLTAAGQSSLVSTTAARDAAAAEADRAEAEADRAAASLPVPGPPGPQGPSTPAGVSFGGLTLSAGSPVVPELKNVNEWVVTDSVQVQLPAVSNGSQFTVHVKSGFQGLTWPPLTEVYGATSEDEAWVTLIRGESNWVALVPSGGSAGLVDTALWDSPLNAMWMGGNPVQWTAGDASMLGTGWGCHEVGSFGGTNVSVRRIGNEMHVKLMGFKVATTSASALMVTIPMPVGASFDSTATSHAVPGTLNGDPVTLNLTTETVHGTTREVRFYCSNLTQGVWLGTVAPSGNIPTSVKITLPLLVTSTWGI